MPFVNAFLMLINSFQFRLMIAEMFFCRGLQVRKGMHILLPLGIALLTSLPEISNLTGNGSFYTRPEFQILNFSYSFLIVFAISLAVLFICFQVSFNELLFLGAGAYISQNLVYNLGWIVKYLFFPGVDSYLTYDSMNYFSYTPESLLYNCLCVGILISGYCFIYFFFVRRWNQGHELYVERHKMLAFLLLTILLLSIVSSAAANTGSGNLYVAILLAACSICLLMIQFNIFDLSKERYEKEIEKCMVNAAIRQEKMSREAVNLINIKAHDLKRSLDAIKCRVCDEDISQELQETERAIREYDAVIDVGNEALNTILTEKNLLCIQNQIEFTVRADGSALSFMKPMDIYLLFGNALDNAIEHLKQENVENRVIDLHLFSKGKHTVLSIENYCAQPLHFQEGLPQTVKEDKTIHGFGMKSIRSIVEKYEGNMVVQQNGTIFSLQILF